MKSIKIRSITYAIDLSKIGETDYLEKVKLAITHIKSKLNENNLFVRTIRFNILTHRYDQILDQFHFLRRIEILSQIADNLEIRWFNVSFDITNETEKNIKTICNIGYEILKRFKNSFVNFLITKNKEIGAVAALHCAHTIIKASKLSSNGFDNFRMGISLNPKENTPFFPFSYALKDNCFSIAVEVARSIEEEIKSCNNESFEVIRKRLINSIGTQSQIIDGIAIDISNEIGTEYSGLDMSLAPFPDEGVSVVGILKLLGLEEIGANGSLFFTSFLTDLLKEIITRYNLKATGFNGVMYSLLEDQQLCEANNKKLLSIDSLILYSSLCGCGLDMVPVPGNILEEELASIILDVASLSIRLDKPLGVRILPIPNGFTNEYTQFDMDFLTNTRILDVKNLGCASRVFSTSYTYFAKSKFDNRIDSDDFKEAQKSIKEFWDKRAEKFSFDGSLSATNLEENNELQQDKLEIEREKIMSLIALKHTHKCLDLGCGVGAWSELLSKNVEKVVAVDYSQKMIDLAKSRLIDQGISNIEYYCNDAAKFEYDEDFDVIFISGLLLYMTDDQVDHLSIKINSYSKEGTTLIVREPTGVENRHLIINNFSEILKTKYSALYRTRNELVSIFESSGFKLKMDDNMFVDGSPLNKWRETRLRVYVFEKTKIKS